LEERAINAHNRDKDERLAIEAAQKDPARFAELYENNFERVYAYIARRVHDRTEAEDVTSEVFHQALANLPKFQWRGVPFAAWLFRIAANSIIDRGNRAAREQELPEGFELPSEAGSEVIDDEVERRARLFQFVSRLPEDQRLVISKRFSEEKSIREIANEIGRSEGAVKQLQFRAVQTLRAWLTDEPGDRNG
jgi:RNA polymerase sigma-70 factor (ECF subfamily)